MNCVPNNLSTKWSLDLHRKTIFKCDFCDKSLHTKALLLDHHKSAHNNAPNDADIKKLSQTISTKNTVEISKVSREYKRTLSYNVFTIPLSTVSIYKCDVCDQTFHHKARWEEQKEKSHDKKCDICSKFYVSALHVTNHKKSDFDIRTNSIEKCYICFNTVSTKSALQKHLKKFHVQCNKCDNYFDSESDLDLHFIATHVNEKSSEEFIKRTLNANSNRASFKIYFFNILFTYFLYRYLTEFQLKKCP